MLGWLAWLAGRLGWARWKTRAYGVGSARRPFKDGSEVFEKSCIFIINDV